MALMQDLEILYTMPSLIILCLIEQILQDGIDARSGDPFYNAIMFCLVVQLEQILQDGIDA